MKKCPYCAEEILEEAIKCKHCGEFLNKKEKTPWYFRTSSLVTGFLCFGPLALPLLWFNPNVTRRQKISISVIVIVISYFLAAAAINSLRSIGRYYRLIFGQF